MKTWEANMEETKPLRLTLECENIKTVIEHAHGAEVNSEELIMMLNAVIKGAGYFFEVTETIKDLIRDNAIFKDEE